MILSKKQLCIALLLVAAAWVFTILWVAKPVGDLRIAVAQCWDFADQIEALEAMAHPSEKSQ